MAERVNAATELAREHAEIDRLIVRIAELEPCPERTRLAGEVAELFLAHVDAEQRFLYPALRRFVPGGWGEVAEEGRRQRAVARTVRAIESLGEKEGDEYDILVGHLVIGIQDHVERQDAVLLPRLIDACPIEDINRLGRQLSDGVQEALAALSRARRVAAETDARRPHGGSASTHGFKALLRRFFNPAR
jgi:hypothetical protein